LRVHSSNHCYGLIALLVNKPTCFPLSLVLFLEDILGKMLGFRSLWHDEIPIFARDFD